MAAKGPVTSDEDLMRAVQQGRHEAFELLFDRYRSPMWRFFRRRISDAARAEELAQDTFVAVLQGASRYQPLAPFRSYLFAIAYNLLLAERRKALHQLADFGEIEVGGSRGGDPEVSLIVRGAIGQLDVDDREILMLREYDELTYEEIAKLKRLPLNTVRSRLFRARMALKTVLDLPVPARVKVIP